MQQSAPWPCSRKSLRIAVVTETYPPEINGVARTAGLMVDGLLARGHRVELIRPRQASDDQTSSVLRSGHFEERLTAGIALPKYPELQLGLARISPLVKAWRERRPDLAHLVTEGPLGWAALLAARKLAIPVVSDFHTNFHEYSRHYGCGWFSGLVTGYLRALHKRTQCTFVPTRQMQDRLSALGFGRIEVVGRGIDTRLFSPARRSLALRQLWGCSGDAPVALYVGRLAPEKNLRLFVDTVRCIRLHRPALRVVVVGDGPLGASLRAAHPDFQFAGMRTGEDLAAHYASADLFLFPSLSETFGNVTLEAMASGLAVVAFDYAAAAEHIVHGRNGLLAPREDEAAFLRHAVRLACDPNRIRRMRERARQSTDPLTWDRSIDALETLLIGFSGTPEKESAILAPDPTSG